MRIGKISVVVIGLVPFNVYGECTPTPDCASIGYTETSCEGAFIKCPFDTSKLYCVPCDSSFKYTCSGENITGGTGSACGGKYVSCECFVGGKFNNGMCVCDAACTVGAIYYSDGSCSSCVIPSKTPIGVVVKDNELIVALNIPAIYWSADRENIVALSQTKYETDAKADKDGIGHTLMIVDHYGADADTSMNAGVYCYNYAPIGLENSINNWYLPAPGELYEYLYGNGSNYNKIKATWSNLGISFSEVYFWASLEETFTTAWLVNVNDGSMIGKSKTNSFMVGCFLEI